MAKAKGASGQGSDLTPMMRQYLAAKDAHPDAIVMFRLGDFFELFFDDAKTASEVCELTLTSRGTFQGEPMPMAGVPAIQVEPYIRRLLAAGHRVALCDQVEDARKARGIVRREVTRVLSPGVRLDSDGLDQDRTNFLVALAPAEEEREGAIGLAAIDVSTGELRGAEVTDLASLTDELARLDPAEVVLPEAGTNRHERGAPQATLGATALERALRAWRPDLVIGPVRPPAEADATAALPIDVELPDRLRAAADLLGTHLASMRVLDLDHVRPLVRYSPGAHLILDATTLSNLEVFRTTGGATGKGTLSHLLQRTRSAPGARTLRAWLSRPLRGIEAISKRQDAVELLLAEPERREHIRELLGAVKDIERITARAVAGTATPRDLGALRDSIGGLPGLRVATGDTGTAWLDELASRIDPLEDLHAHLDSALVDSPPVQSSEGGIIRSEHDEGVKELRLLSEQGARWFMEYEAEQRSRTGIGSLKVRYNKVFGYYIEVTRPHLHRVPEDYIRKQTIANGERFITSELKDMEAKILGGSDRLKEIEAELFAELRKDVAAEAPRLQRTAMALGELDALSALADLSAEHGYCRPELHEGAEIEIKESRHPTLEALLPPGEYVPNDLDLGGEHGRLLLITGPNMAGKSTVMRQVALAVIMAQMGAWVPAAEARIGIVDRVFTRVGASDSITTGRSTFMVEMVETADIVRHATERSLVLLDEIGRGTATFDGLSIAWAVAEDLHDRARARTLFATHYHELCALADTRDGVRNQHVAVREWDGSIVFLRRLMPGSMRRSYGVEVARLAGLSESVVERARGLLEDLERGQLTAPLGRGADGHEGDLDAQLDLFAPEPIDPRWSKVKEIMEGVDPDSCTPMEALEVIYRLKGEVEG